MASVKEVKEVLKRFYIETPSWAYGNSGTRFKVFAQPGVPRDPYEKISDAAQVNKFTGAAPAVAMHIPWDKVDDYAKLAKLDEIWSQLPDRTIAVIDDIGYPNLLHEDAGFYGCKLPDEEKFNL